MKDRIMKFKVVSVLLAGCLLSLAAWLVHVSNPAYQPEASARADQVPEKYRETVQKGLAYLAQNQAKDGHWEGDGGKHPVAMTGLVGLALLMEMEGPNSGRRGRAAAATKHSPNIRKAVDWLMDQSQAKRDGLIFSEHPSETARYMQGHGLATLFLAGAFEYEPDEERREKLTAVLTRAVKYILKAQSSQGGWYHTSKVEGHDFATISATVIQIQALEAAENAGIPVPREAVNDAHEYLKMALEKYAEPKAAQDRRPADTAAALACRRVSKDEWCEYCQAKIPVGRDIKFGRDELTQYYYAQALFQVGGNGHGWSVYRTAMFDHLQSSQNKDGSWPAGDGISVGPVYATALWCTVLQLDRRTHPSMPQIEVAVK
jgi:hypothetical protein